MLQSKPRARLSTAIILGAAVLLILALIYGATVALFGILLSRPTHGAVLIGDIRLSSNFGFNGPLVFGLLCLLSGYGGLASIWRWPRWMAVAQAAGWATIGLSVYGIWTFLNIIAPGLPYPPFAIGIYMPFYVSLVAGVIGIFVLWAMRKPAEKNL